MFHLGFRVMGLWGLWGGAGPSAYISLNLSSKAEAACYHKRSSYFQYTKRWWKDFTLVVDGFWTSSRVRIKGSY